MRFGMVVFLAVIDTLFAQTSLPKTFQDETNAWYKVHPPPKANASPEERQAYDQEVAGATATWVMHWPDDPRAWLQRLERLNRLKSTSNEQLEEIGETVVRIAKEHPFKGFRFVPFQTDVAMIWTGRKIRPGRSLELTQEAVREDKRAERDNPFRRQTAHGSVCPGAVPHT